MAKMILRLLRMAKPYWGLLLISVLALLMASLAGLVTPEVVRNLTRVLTTAEAGTQMPLLFRMILILMAAFLVRALCRFTAMSVSHVAAWKFVPQLTFQIYDKLQSLSMKYYQDKKTGQLMSRMVNDTRLIELLIALALPDLLGSLLVVIGVTVMLFRIHVTLALITMIPVPFIIYASTLYSKKVAPLFRINQQVLGELNGVLQDNLSGMKEIQAFGQEMKEHLRMDKLRKRYEEVNIRANFVNGAFHPGIEFLTSMGTVVVVGLGGYLATKGQMSAADVVGFLMYLGLFYTPVTQLARLSGGQKQRIAIARAILRDSPILILDEATSAVDTETETEIQEAIERLKGSWTMLVIALRLSTVMRSDRILVLHEGRIEEGTHRELMEKNGIYRHLWDLSLRLSDTEQPDG